MPKRRRGIESSTNFFSFQDIMMSALGVMVLLSAVIILQLKPITTPGAAGDPSIPASSQPVDAERNQLVTKIHDLEAKSVRMQQAFGRDVDRDLATVHTELERLKAEQQQGDERLARLIDRLGLKREGKKADAQSLLALDLIDQRDALTRELEGFSNRRRLVFQMRRSDGLRTRVFEVAGNRIVEAFDDSTANAIMHTFSSDKEGAQILVERMKDADGKRNAVLIALKPSGVGVYRTIWSEQGSSQDSSKRPTNFGIDLITEDGWISDEHPASESGGG